MKTMCPHSYHYNEFVATYALGHMMMYGYIVLSLCLLSIIYKLNESVVGTKWSTNNELGTKKGWKDTIYQKLKLITAT